MYPGIERSSNIAGTSTYFMIDPKYCVVVYADNSNDSVIDSAGLYDDYDPRYRSWYLGAQSGPKDVVILIDCSISMLSGYRAVSEYYCM